MTYEQTVDADAPEWYLRLGASNGLVDSSGNGRNGAANGGITIGGATGLLLGDPDEATQFDGTDDWIGVPYVVGDNVDDFTIECWVQTTQSGRGLVSRELSGSSKAFRWIIQSGKQLFSRVNSVGSIVQATGSNTTVTDGAIHHVAIRVTGMTTSNAVLTYFLDGQPDGTYTFTDPVNLSTWTTDFLIGHYRNVAFFLGVMDEVAFYKRALTDTELAEHYDAGTTSPIANPTAEFTFTVSGLTVDFDASPTTLGQDSPIVAWDWDFGDGTTGNTGPTISHTYAADGNRTVTLTVTAENGKTDEVSHDLFAGLTIASDTFARTIASGWGTADVGGDWHSTSLMSTDGSHGVVTYTAAGQGATPSLLAVDAADVDLTFDLRADFSPANGPLYITPHLRGDADSYRPKFRFQDGDLNLQMTKVSGGTAVNLMPGYDLQIQGIPDGSWVHYRVQVFGSAPATLRAHAWVDGDPEPATWTEVQDTDPLLLSGPLGIEMYLSGAATNLPVLWVDDFVAVPYNLPDQPPTCSIDADVTANVEPWSTVTLTLADNDDVGITDRTLTQDAGPTVALTGTVGNGEALTFQAPAVMGGTTLTFTYQVDDGTHTASDTVNVDVMTPACSIAQPDGTEKPARLFLVVGD